MAKDIHVKRARAICCNNRYTIGAEPVYNWPLLRRIPCADPSPPGGQVSPILVRPVREQLEHDRVIRLLQVKLKRKHEVVANIGEDQSTSGQDRPAADLPGPRADDGRSRPQADGNGRGRDLRIGQPPRSAGPVGASRPGARPVSPLRAGRLGRHRAPAGDREPGQRLRDLELPHDWRPDPFHGSCIARRRTRARSNDPRGIVTSTRRRPAPSKPVPRAPPRPVKAPPRRSRAPARSAVASRRARRQPRRPPRLPAGRRSAPRRRAQGERRASSRSAAAPASPLRHAPRKGSRSCRTCASIATSMATRTRSSSRAIAAAGGRGRASSTGFARRPA